MSRRAAVLVAVLLCVAAPRAQQDERARALDAQIDRIFAARDYDAPRFGPARWLPDGTAYTIVEHSAAQGGAPEIVRYDARSGARTVLVPGSLFDLKGHSAPADVADYSWSADGRRTLLFTNTRKVWRQNTRGDYWVFDVAARTLRQLRAPAASMMFAKFSPDGSRVAYVLQNDIYVQSVDDGRLLQLTADGSATTINGTSDWVYEEELNVRDGFRWSPDGTKIAFWQFDTTGVGDFTLINDTDSTYPTATHIPYPKAGTRNSAVRIGVVTADEHHAVRWMQTPGDSRDDYLARLDWLDAQTVAIEQLNRLQNRNDLLLADAGSGETRRIFRDESATWVEVMDDLRWIDGGRACIWLSERDGWQHAYRVPRDGGKPTLVTRFDADVIDVAGVRRSRRVAVFHRLAGTCNRSLPVPLQARWQRPPAARLAGGRPRHARLRRRTARAARVPQFLAVRSADVDRGRRSAGPSRAASAHRHGRTRRQARTDRRSTGRVPDARHQQRRQARRLDAEAEGVRRIPQISGRRLRLR